MANISKSTSCKEHFKVLKILTLPSLYIFHSILFVVNNMQEFQKNNCFHNYETRYNRDLAIPVHRLKLAEKNIFYSGIKLFNNLPQEINHENLN